MGVGIWKMASGLPMAHSVVSRGAREWGVFGVARWSPGGEPAEEGGAVFFGKGAVVGPGGVLAGGGRGGEPGGHEALGDHFADHAGVLGDFVEGL